MPRAKKPKPLGLELIVRHPDSDVVNPKSPDGEDEFLDSDGHETTYAMVPMGGEDLCCVLVHRGCPPNAAAALLRKVAARLNAHGSTLLNVGRGECGLFDAEGVPMKDMLLSINYDESGNYLEERPKFE